MKYEEEAMNTLLSESEDEGLEGDLYKMAEMNPSGKNGFLLKKNKKGTKDKKTGLFLKCVLCLSLIINVILFVFVMLNKNDKKYWKDTDLLCGISSTQSSALPSPSIHPPTSSSSSSSSSPSLNSTAPKNSVPQTPIEAAKSQELLREKQQQQQLNQGDPQVACLSCPPNVNVPICGRNEALDGGHNKVNAGSNQQKDMEYTNIFADLTEDELKAAYLYLAKEFNLNTGHGSSLYKCRVMMLELHTPNKTQALLFLDSYAPKPVRQAQAMVSCEHSRPPVIKEIVIGPLPNATYHMENPRRKNSNIPLKFSPTYGLQQAYQTVYKEIAVSRGLQNLIAESYGVTTLIGCKINCITFLSQKTSSAYNDDVVYTITAYYVTEFITLNPLDLIFVLKEMIPYGKLFIVTNVFYGGQNFKSSANLLKAYDSGAVAKTKIKFPKAELGETSVPGSNNLRGDVFPSEPKAGPKSYEPDGKRYSIKNQHVNYMKWSFNMRLNTDSGPQLWDVRWGKERIAYEISLQDIGVLYAGANPSSFFAHLSDSAFGLGDKASGLLPGLDCPEGATFLSKTVIGRFGNPTVLPHSQCVFEHNTERPLRRHRNRDSANGQFTYGMAFLMLPKVWLEVTHLPLLSRNHGGLVDRVLIVRTVIVEYNYDYIFDMIFHQNGALELKTYATGYIMSQHYYNGEKPFGFKVFRESVGSIHNHIFHYKIDLDIVGTSNRYETLDLELDERPWAWYHEGKEAFKQTSFQHNLRETEIEAVLRYNYSKPKYHIVYNDEMKNKFGNHRAYRVASKGFTKIVLPDDSPVLSSRKWAKYDMLVTRRKDSEERSSSIFSMFDGASPHIDVDRYLQDNETILDEDLVFWFTVGMNHIPHTEDIPNTPTVGTEAAILITPYNYFPECPSVGSRDFIRVDRRTTKVMKKDYGVDWNKRCVPASYNFEELFSSPLTLYS